MGTLEIEPATDASALLEMMADYNRLEGISWSPDSARPALEKLLSSPELGFVGLLRERGVTRGYFVLTWGFDLEWSGRDAFLTELYLLPEARGRRLGTEALPLIETAATAKGVRALHLMVRPENVSARRLYARAGYESPPRVFLSKPLP
jgi:ribosomal protein S18 acetylase RimI-like enzyme